MTPKDESLVRQIVAESLADAVAKIPTQRGPEGQRGDTGKEGPRGADGPPGRDGYSHFEEITQLQSRVNWLEDHGAGLDDKEVDKAIRRVIAGDPSLKGDPGAPGLQGPTGERGPRGLAGRDAADNSEELNRLRVRIEALEALFAARLSNA